VEKYCAAETGGRAGSSPQGTAKWLAKSSSGTAGPQAKGDPVDDERNSWSTGGKGAPKNGDSS
jgi:hypothetical protein